MKQLTNRTLTPGTLSDGALLATATLLEEYSQEQTMTDHSSLEAENERLRRVNQMYRDAMAFAGHEWRNRLSLLSVSLSVLEHEIRDVLNEDQKESLERIRLDMAVIMRVARVYLSMSQAERESFPIRAVFVDPIRDVITPTLFSYKGMLTERQQTYVIQEGQPNPLVWADRDMLAVIYDNLIGNAIKHGGPGGKIVLSVLERGMVDELSVWNSGPGIPDEQIEALVDPFATSAHENREWFAGIGLYLTRRIIEAHGGTMRIESWPGTGVKVIFTLPKRRVAGGY
jgi:signal transduction histidine kinase